MADTGMTIGALGDAGKGAGNRQSHSFRSAPHSREFWLSESGARVASQSLASRGEFNPRWIIVSLGVCRDRPEARIAYQHRRKTTPV